MIIKEIFQISKIDDICNFFRKHYFNLELDTFVFKRTQEELEAVAGKFQIQLTEDYPQQKNKINDFNPRQNINYMEQILKIQLNLDSLYKNFIQTKRDLTQKLDTLQQVYKQETQRQAIQQNLKSISLKYVKNKQMKQGKQISESHGLFSVNDQKFGVSSQTSVVEIFNKQSLQINNNLIVPGQVSSSCSIDSSNVIIGGKNKKNQLFMFNLTTSSKRINTLNYSSQISVIKSKNEYIFTAGGDHQIRVYDFTKCQEIVQLQGFTEQISDLVDIDQCILAGCGWDSNVRIWDCRNEKQIKQYSRSNWLKFIKKYQESIIFGGNDGFLSKWDWKRTNQIIQLSVGFQISSLEIIYNDMAYGGQNQNLFLTNGNTLNNFKQFQTHGQQPIKSLLNCNDQTLITGNSNLCLEIFKIEKQYIT